MSLSVFPNLAEDLEVFDSAKLTLYSPNANPAIQSKFVTKIVSQSSGDFVSAGLQDASSDLMNGVYEYSNNNYTCTIGVDQLVADVMTEGGYTRIEANIELLSYSGSNGFICTQTTNKTVSVSGIPKQVFTDAYYQFLMNDNTVKTLPQDTQEDFKALVRWSPPKSKEITITHNFLVKINYLEDTLPKTAIQVLTVPQTIRWRLDLAVVAFRNALAKGKI